MVSGKNEGSNMDPLTEWALAANDILQDIHPGEAIQKMGYRDRMLKLVEALDQGDLDLVFGKENFINNTEDLLLAMLRGEKIEVAAPVIFKARNEIFAAAQVIYNQGVARGFWELHPEIRQAMDEDQ
jgi:hypothetical protein